MRSRSTSWSARTPRARASRRTRHADSQRSSDGRVRSLGSPRRSTAPAPVAGRWSPWSESPASGNHACPGSSRARIASTAVSSWKPRASRTERRRPISRSSASCACTSRSSRVMTHERSRRRSSARCCRSIARWSQPCRPCSRCSMCRWPTRRGRGSTHPSGVSGRWKESSACSFVRAKCSRSS